MYSKHHLPMRSKDEMLVFSSGQIIYESGDPGGDAYIVEKGEIELYQQKNGKEVVLGIIRPGGFVGTLTCFSNENCIDCARASGEVVLKKIKQSQISRLASSLPPWMKAMLFDFISTIISHKKELAELTQTNLDLKRNQVNYNFIASRIGSISQSIFPILAKPQSPPSKITLQELQDHIKAALIIPEETLSEIFTALAEVNLINLKSDPSLRDKTLGKEDIDALMEYTQFFLASKKGKVKRLVESEISSKDIKCIHAILGFAKKMGLDDSKLCYLSIEDLENSIEKVMSVKFEIEPLQLAEKLSLLQFAPGRTKITFIPNELGKIISHIATYKKLERLEHFRLTKNKSKSAVA